MLNDLKCEEDECCSKAKYVIEEECGYKSPLCWNHAENESDTKNINLVIQDYMNNIDDISRNSVKAQAIYQYSLIHYIKQRINKNDFKGKFKNRLINSIDIEKNFNKIQDFTLGLKTKIEHLKPHKDFEKLGILTQFTKNIDRLTKELHCNIGKHIAGKFSDEIYKKYQEDNKYQEEVESKVLNYFQILNILITTQHFIQILPKI